MTKTRWKNCLILVLSIVCALAIWAGVSLGENKKAFAVTKTDVKAMGVDISTWQGTVNFDTLASKASFVILRIGYGTTLDDRFTSYLSAARSRGMNIGVYVYSHADNTAEAIAEANFVVNQLNAHGLGSGGLTYPVYFDYEESTIDSRSRATNTNIINAFMNTVRNAGYYPGLYMGGSKMNGYININDVNGDIWVAAYGVGWSGFTSSYYNSKVKMWQFETGAYGNVTGDAQLGSAFGVSSTYIDQNYCFVDYPSIIRSSGLNGFSWGVKDGTYSIEQGQCHVDEWGNNEAAGTTGQSIPYCYVNNNAAFSSSFNVSAKFVNTYPAETYNLGSCKFGYCPIYIDDNNWILVYCSWENSRSTTSMKSVEMTGEINGTAISAFGQYNYVSAFVYNCETIENGNPALKPLQTASTLSSGYTINTSITKNNITVTVNGIETHNVNVDLSAVVGKSNSKLALFSFWADLTVSNLTTEAIVWTENNGTYTIGELNCHVDEWGVDESTKTTSLATPVKTITNSQASASSFKTSAKFVNTYPAETLQYGSNKFGYYPLYIDENNWILVYCSWDTNISTTRMKSVELTGLINGTAISDFGTVNYVSAWVHDCDTATDGNKALVALQTASTLSSGYTINTEITSSSIIVTVNGVQTHNVSVDLSALTSNSNKKLALFSFWADLTVSEVSCSQLVSSGATSGSASGGGSQSGTYTIKFNKNGGTGSMGNVTATVGEAKKLSKNTFTREGFVFKGWATSANGAVVYADELSVTDLTSADGTVTLYAVWEEETTSGSGSANDSNTNGNNGNQSSGGGCFGSVDLSSVVLTIVGLGAIAMIAIKLARKEN